jgi:hypothetical protein
MEETRMMKTLRLLATNVDDDKSNELFTTLQKAESMLRMGIDTKTVCNTLNIEPSLLAAYDFIEASEVPKKEYVIPVTLEVKAFVTYETANLDAIPKLLCLINSEEDTVIKDKIINAVSKNINTDKIMVDETTVSTTSPCLYQSLEEIDMLTNACEQSKTVDFSPCLALVEISNKNKKGDESMPQFETIDTDDVYGVKEFGTEDEVFERDEELEAQADPEEEFFERDEELEAQADPEEETFIDDSGENWDDWDDEVFC